MNNTSVNYNITNAENGFIVNKTTETETEKDNTFSSLYTNETFVYNNWSDVLVFLADDEAQSA